MICLRCKQRGERYSRQVARDGGLRISKQMDKHLCREGCRSQETRRAPHRKIDGGGSQTARLARVAGRRGHTLFAAMMRSPSFSRSSSSNITTMRPARMSSRISVLKLLGSVRRNTVGNAMPKPQPPARSPASCQAPAPVRAWDKRASPPITPRCLQFSDVGRLSSEAPAPLRQKKP
jgi:hypothetical protein